MAMKLVRPILLALALFSAAPAWAVLPDEMLSDPALEARARVLSKELRCMVCQNQSIDDSEAPLAHDLRVLVRQRLEAGDTDKQVLGYLVARYGDFVLLRPPFKPETLLLWILPPAALGAGFIALFMIARRRNHVPNTVEALTPEEKARLSTLVAGPGPEH